MFLIFMVIQIPWLVSFKNYHHLYVRKATEGILTNCGRSTQALITILSYGFPNNFHGTVVLLYTVYSG